MKKLNGQRSTLSQLQNSMKNVKIHLDDVSICYKYNIKTPIDR